MVAKTKKGAGPKGVEKTKKKKKDPNAPKKNLTAYFMFQKEVRPQIVADNPNLKVSEVAKEIGEQWKNLDQDQKSKYEKLAEQDKERYQREMEAYNSKRGDDEEDD